MSGLWRMMVGMSDWHPILAAVEGPIGCWRMIDPHGREYGSVMLVRARRDGGEREPVYKCERDGELLGWAVALRSGCALVHDAFLRSHGPQGGANGIRSPASSVATMPDRPRPIGAP